MTLLPLPQHHDKVSVFYLPVTDWLTCLLCGLLARLAFCCAPQCTRASLSWSLILALFGILFSCLLEHCCPTQSFIIAAILVVFALIFYLFDVHFYFCWSCFLLVAFFLLFYICFCYFLCFMFSEKAAFFTAL